MLPPLYTYDMETRLQEVSYASSLVPYATRLNHFQEPREPAVHVYTSVVLVGRVSHA